MRCISYIPVILLHRQNCHSLILCVWSWVSTVKNLVDQVNEIGLKFGIWFEPKMISPDSDLYEKHPEWAIQIQNREAPQSRNQYVLDLSRREVRVYELQERLVTDFPDLLLENCSGGGARFDPGMLYYSPQIWCSDDTDALERLMIQEGTELIYPLSAMGVHVSDCPNHIAGRDTKDAGADDDVMPLRFLTLHIKEAPAARPLIRFYQFFCGCPAFSDPVRR